MTDTVLFWTIAVIVTGFVLLALIPPLLGRGSRAPARDEQTSALYRTQMRQVEDDLANGRLTEADAEAARSSIGRRLLAAADTPDAPAGGVKPKSHPVRARTWAAAVIVAAPAAAVGLYLTVGQPGMPDQPIGARKDVADAAQMVASAESLVSEMSIAIERDDGDLRSWVMLARALATLERIDDAADAYARAVALAPDQADLSAAYGEILVRQADGQVTDPAASAFSAALAQVSDDPRALYYMALRRYQQGDLGAALAEWRALAADSPADAPWMDVVRRRVAETEQALGADAVVLADATTEAREILGESASPGGGDRADPAVDDAPAPALPDTGYADADGVTQGLSQAPSDNSRTMATGATAFADTLATAPPAMTEPAPEPQASPAAPPLTEEQIEGVLALSADEQSGRIAAMVGGLADRLRRDPDDVDGWMILARSYGVQGDASGARQALENAVRYGPDRIDAQLAYARLLLEGQAIDAPVPEEAVTAFKQVIAQDPSHPDALWFLGLAAAQQRDFDTARGHWRKLLDTLDPDSEAYVDVQSYIAALSGGQPIGEGDAAGAGPVDSTNAVEPAESQ